MNKHKIPASGYTKVRKKYGSDQQAIILEMVLATENRRSNIF
ncbi:MAG: hypothetical protein QNJ54_04530 [Prochloraceae cyanobacterium]|nr:hypothetical protein [Prochloraceae cyanobacterium]